MAEGVADLPETFAEWVEEVVTTDTAAEPAETDLAADPSAGDDKGPEDTTIVKKDATQDNAHADPGSDPVPVDAPIVLGEARPVDAAGDQGAVASAGGGCTAGTHGAPAAWLALALATAAVAFRRFRKVA